MYGGNPAIVDSEEKFSTVYKMTQKTNEEKSFRGTYVIGLKLRATRMGMKTEWSLERAEWSDGTQLNESFIKDPGPYFMEVGGGGSMAPQFG
jgi:hypothetical protein